MQQENKKKKIIVVGSPVGIGKDTIRVIEKLAEKKGLEAVLTPPKSLKEQIEETIPKENLMLLEVPTTVLEVPTYVTDIDKPGIRGVTNNMKLKKKRKKKGKKTHRSKRKKK